MLNIQKLQYWQNFHSNNQLLIETFIQTNFVPQIHTIGRPLVLYKNLISFIANTGKKIAFYLWYEYYHSINMVLYYRQFQKILSPNIRRGTFCFVYGRLVSLTLRNRGLSYTQKYHSFIARKLSEVLNMMISGTLEQLFAKLAHMQVKKMCFSNLDMCSERKFVQAAS